MTDYVSPEEAAAFAQGVKERLEHCARCGKLLPFTPPGSVSFNALIYCGTECAELAREEQAEIDRCPACGERDPNAEHEEGHGGAWCTPGYEEPADPDWPPGND